MSRPRSILSVLGGLATIGVLLALPAPHRTAASSTPAHAGPPTLSSVWAAAKPFTIPTAYPDGSTYTPRLVVDPATSIGELARPGGVRTDLVVAAVDGSPRVLQSRFAADGGSYEGITATTDRIIWMHADSDADGRARFTLWTAARAGGPATELTADTGAPVFYNSSYDIQVVAGLIYWAANHPRHDDQTDDQTELRSTPVTGGPVSVQVITGAWELSAWPWLVTAPTTSGRPTQLHNLTTGTVTTVPSSPDRLTTCSPHWCRLTPNHAGDTAATTLIHTDGTHRHVIGDAKAIAVDSDVALLDRFELLNTTTSGNELVTVSTLALYDLTAGRSVLITQAATNAAGSGTYIWWSTGDNETLTWHGLDLHTLT